MIGSDSRGLDSGRVERAASMLKRCGSWRQREIILDNESILLWFWLIPERHRGPKNEHCSSDGKKINKLIKIKCRKTKMDLLWSLKVTATFCAKKSKLKIVKCFWCWWHGEKSTDWHACPLGFHVRHGDSYAFFKFLWRTNSSGHCYVDR